MDISDGSDDEGDNVRYPRWETLSHNGVLFPPAYDPHLVPLIYDGQEIVLPVSAEEMASMYAAMLETDYVRNPIFQQNFFQSWRRILQSNPMTSHIEEMAKCDFSLIAAHLARKKEERRGQSRAERDAEKRRKEEDKQRFGYALVDGHQEPLGNYMVEPPGLFRGRGQHPDMGKWKGRLQPEDITLNLSADAPLPPCPVQGHDWDPAKRVCRPEVSWIAHWEDFKGNIKYVFFSPDSHVYYKEKERRLEKVRAIAPALDGLRARYMHDLTVGDPVRVQCGVAVYFIDRLRMCLPGSIEEVEGNCLALLVKHVCLREGSDRLTVRVPYRHLTMRWDADLPPEVAGILRRLTESRTSEQLLLPDLTKEIVVAYLNELHRGLTSRNLRLCAGSVAIERSLREAAARGGINSEVDARIAFHGVLSTLCGDRKFTPAIRYDQRVDACHFERDALLRSLTEPNHDPIAVAARLREVVTRLEAILDASEDDRLVISTLMLATMFDLRVVFAWCARVGLDPVNLLGRSQVGAWDPNIAPDWRYLPE